MNYQELKEKKAEILKEFEANGKELLAETAQAIFQSHPDVDSIGWTQYTPYYNDGDACQFGVRSYSDATYVNHVVGYADEDPIVLNPIRKKIEDLLSHFDEDDMELMFGDHSMITIYRDGTVEIEAYEHD